MRGKASMKACNVTHSRASGLADIGAHPSPRRRKDMEHLNGPRVLAGRLGLGALVALVLGVLAASPAWAHQDPPGCNGVGVGIAIFPFRADGVTPVGSKSVTNCETLVFKAQVNYQPSGNPSVPTCAFEGGNLILTTPDGVNHTIATNIPCVGGTTNDPNSASNGGRGLCLGAPTSFPDPETGVTYTVRDQDIVNGFVAVNAKYPETLGTSFNHTSSTDSVGGTATNQQPIPVISCPVVNTGCEQAGCDPVTFACFDNHDTCPVASTGCEQAGCDPTKTFPGCFHTTVTCSNPTCQQCDASTGLCGPITPTPPRCVGHRHDPRRRRPG